MNTLERRDLDTLSLAALLISAHYGLGFLIGTAEESFTLATAGSLYAVSLSLGMIALLLLARMYWTEGEQIWTLLGDRYGRFVKQMIGVMAWSSLIGIEAVQIISAAAILQVLQVPAVPAMIGVSLVALGLSLLPLQRMGLVFQLLLAFNILALLYLLAVLHGFPLYVRSPLHFIPDLTHLKAGDVFGISVATVLLVMIDMKCQQFLVRAREPKVLYQGAILAGIGLFLLAFLPTAVMIAAQNAGILPVGISGKSALPYLLTWAGGGADHPLGILLLLALLVPALGVSSSILRIQTKNLLDLGILPTTNPNRLILAVLNTALGLVVALKGGEIIGLIMEFYAAYIAAVWIPFAAYLVGRSGRYQVANLSIQLSLILGSIAALIVLAVAIALPNAGLVTTPELSIILAGGSFGLVGLLLGQGLSSTVFKQKPAPYL